MRRQTRPIAAWLAIVALLFAQLATSAFACPNGDMTVSAQAASDECDRGSADLPNLCERHCDYGNASVDTPKPAPSPALVAMIVPTIAVILPQTTPRAAYHARASTGPPLTRFTVLRI